MKNPSYILHGAAVTLCFDWIRSDTYKDKVKFETFRESSSLWQQIEYDRKHSGRLDWEEDENRLKESIKYAAERGWVIRQFTKIGRPRTKDHSKQDQMKAERAVNRHLAESTLKRLRSVSGGYQLDSHLILTVTDKLFDEYVSNISPDEIAGLTRDELLELTRFHPKVNNRLWTWLKAKGWTEKRGQRAQPDETIIRVRTIHKIDVQK